jgi:hypothetical protein
VGKVGAQVQDHGGFQFSGVAHDTQCGTAVLLDGGRSLDTG